MTVLMRELPPGGPPEEPVFVLPASYAQQRLWFLDRLEPGSPLYNIPMALRLTGALDAGALERALGEIVRRHESLRTTLDAEDGEAVQVIAPALAPGAWRLPRIALGSLAPAERWARARHLAAAEAARPFRLDQGPLFRAVLIDLGSDHLLVLCLHHAIADGWSLGVLQAELAALYRGRTLPEPPIQYADFAVWQRDRSAALLEPQLAWWRERLAGAPLVMEVPLARPRPAARDRRGGWRTLALPAGLVRELQALSRREGVTRFMTLLAAFTGLLHRTTGQTDLVIGTPLAGRDRVETEGLIGLLANVVALRIDAGDSAGGLTFHALLARVRAAFLGAHAHQDLPFERLVEELQPDRSPSHAPLVQILFTVHERAVQAALELPGLAVEPLEIHTGRVKVDLALSLEESAGSLVARLDFAADLLDGIQAERLLACFQTLLSGIAAAPEGFLSQLPVLPEEGLHQSVVEWNDTGGYAPSETIHALFSAQACATPEEVALESGGERLTYRELNARANRLAHHLRSLGAGCDARVAVCLDRSLEAVVAILAVLKAGGGYVPLDPATPRERLAFLLADAGAAVVLTAERHLAKLPELSRSGVPVVVLERERERLASCRTDDPPEQSDQDSLAYVVYTSGSTGRPKGVAVPHRAVVRLVRRTGFADLSSGETWLQLAPMAFDASTLETWGSLLNGARLVVFPGYTPSLAELAAAIEGNGITSLWLTAGLFHQMAGGPIDSLRGVRQLIAGGDVLSPPHVETILARFPRLRLINGYGPTENTTFTCCHRMQGGRRFAGPVPIGRPIAGTRAVLLDDHLQPVPPGAAGELCAGGAGLARAYVHRPDLTAERMVPDPFAALWGEPGARLYRTGDLARHLPDGTIEFLGRRDRQVKIRGFRVEPGEIEAALCDHPAVRAATVLACSDAGRGDKSLMAWVVAEGAALPDLRPYLRERLPESMIPSAFVRLDELPLNANGKVDRRRLLETAPSTADGETRAGEDRTAPRSPLEELVAAVWSELLQRERIGVEDDFFALGGHSLMAMQMVSRLREVCGVEIPLRRLFDTPTVAGLAAAVEAERRPRGGSGLAPAPSIVPVPRNGDLPASFAQERLWFLEQMGGDGTAYNLPVALRLGGPLDPAALAAALSEVARRHETLRTTFRAAEPGPGAVQVIAPPSPVPLPLVDLEGLGDADAAALRLARGEAERRFDLGHGPLLRALLLRLADDEHRLVLAMHHIISDGWSMGVLIRELTALYEAFAAGRPSPLHELAVQYADFAVWQREQLSGESLAVQLAFWRQELAGLPPVLDLPTDRPRPAVRGGAGVRLPFRVPAGGELPSFARRSGATLFMALLAAFHTLLARWSGSDDLAVGSPVANRNRAESEPLIGFFVNALVLRSRLDGSPTFAGLVQRTREALLDAWVHQDLPFEKLVEELRPERSLSHAPLFQVMLILQNAPLAVPRLAGLDLGVEEIAGGAAKFDLTLSLAADDVGLRGQLEVDRDLFDGATAERLLGHFLTLLAAAVAEPDRQAAELELLSPGERAQLLGTWNDTAAPFAGEACLHERFAAQAARTPEAVALVSGAERVRYGDLDRRANRLAQRLRRLRVGPEGRVAIALERTPHLVEALLAVLKAGAAYVPLDPAYPRERLASLLDDCQAGVLLSERSVLERLPAFARTVLCLDEEDLSGESERAPESGVTADNLAYLIYTSGSTGRPKGVAIAHRSAAALLDWAAAVFLPAELAGTLAATSITFDLSVFELFLPLTTGGTVVLAEDALALPELPAAGEVRLVNTVPSAMSALVRSGGVPAGVRTVNLAGEALQRSLADEIYALPGVERVFNLYGPSEGTTYSTWALVPRGEAREPGIGVPIANTRAYAVDRGLGLLPVGVAGELCLGGEGLARGYLNRPELTAERFVPDPFAAREGGRLYRTGDLVRRRAGGELEFLGRIDHQVKIRGFRIELGEVEAAVCAHPQVAEGAVLAREDGAGEHKRLVAYVAPEVPVDLQERLAARLPAHMVPAAFVALSALPRTPSGKVDRKALPAPDRPEASTAPVAPRSPLEELIAGIWCEVLRRERVGVEDDFFALGGHSLLATQVVSRLRAVCGVEIPLRRLFEAPTVAGLAARVAAVRRERESSPNVPDIPAPSLAPVARDRDLPASFAQERVWFLEQMGVEGTAYNLPVVLRLRGPLEPAVLAAALGEIVRRHESLRTSFRAAEPGPGIVQVIAPPQALPLPVVDLRSLRAGDGEAGRLAAEEAGRRFDLAGGPLLRALLLRLEAEHRLVLSMHHIISDGWSLGVLVRELVALYAAYAAGRPSPLPELTVQYADFAVWQRDWLQGEALASQLAYWRRELAGLPPVLDLPTDRPRPAERGGRAGRLPFRVPPGQGLHSLARRSGATLFMALLAAFQALLARWSGSGDVAAGSPIANRTHAETEPLIGFFVNTLVLRAEIGDDLSFAGLLRQVRETTLGAFAHQDLPFEKLVEELRPERALSHSPLFQVMLILQNTPLMAPALPGLELALDEIAGEVAKLDLTIAFAADEEGLRGGLEIDRDLFDGATAERLLGHYVTLLTAGVETPDRPAADLELLSAGERAQLIGAWNETAASLASEACLHERFAAQAARTPQAVALVAGEERISYGDLDRRVRRLASRLRRLGVGPESRVGVAMERTPRLVAALLAVLQAGGAYVPLDPAYPRERLAFLLADSQEGPSPRQASPVLLSERSVLELLPAFAGTVLCLDGEDPGVDGESAETGRASGVTADNLAYLIYTSGSTGRPKGVAITHRSAAALLDWAAAVFLPADVSGVLAATSITFDLSVFELFLPLTTGGTVVLADDAVALPGLPAAGEVRLVNTVPSAMSALVRMGGVPAGVRTVNLAGEALKRSLVEEIYALPGVERVFNLYGPSEDTTYSTWSLVPRSAEREPTIGVPIANARAYVVDRGLRLLPVGVPGELCLGGDGLARGYLNRPELTAAAFVPNPFGDRSGARLYRTGDLARRRADGELEFLGRLDHQVKVRGFRIELGEVEAALCAHPGVRAAVVTARDDVSGSKRLAAYVVPAEGVDAPPDLRDFLRRRLPEHMVPPDLVTLAELPLSPNGKVDRRALPDPAHCAPEEAWLAPETPDQQSLAGIWREVLGVERVGLLDDFFRLGGHSLLAAQVMSRVRREFAVSLPLRSLFQEPTLAGLAEAIRQARENGSPARSAKIVRVSRAATVRARP